ncbi:Aldo/keto reductase-like protein [Fragilaria crotonensis]|nr:Aldo/keto reductase-like protein [Fragilaria crotonensis]
MTWMPRAEPGTPAELNRDQVLFSVDSSLKRFGVDYIDLLQFALPDRYTGGLLGNQTSHRCSLRRDTMTLKSKVRYVGVSNETPYGYAPWLSSQNILQLSIQRLFLFRTLILWWFARTLILAWQNHVTITR